MREIKFRYRIYSITEKRIMETFYKRIDEIENWLNILCDKKNYEILSRDKFTWLLDKNGNEIYEWDIIHAWFPRSDWQIWIDRQYVVNHDWFCFKKDYSKSPYRRDNQLWNILLTADEKSKDLEIIWNIYENPDLITN